MSDTALREAPWDCRADYDDPTQRTVAIRGSMPGAGVSLWHLNRPPDPPREEVTAHEDVSCGAGRNPLIDCQISPVHFGYGESAGEIRLHKRRDAAANATRGSATFFTAGGTS